MFIQTFDVQTIENLYESVQKELNTTMTQMKEYTDERQLRRMQQQVNALTSICNNLTKLKSLRK